MSQRFRRRRPNSLRRVKLLADGLYQLRGFPPDAMNVYLANGVLLDAATRHSGRRILRELKGHEVTAHALTHAHPDHQGASHEVCTKLGIPYWVGEGDVKAAETGDMVTPQPDHPLPRASQRVFAGPGHPVDRVLHEGDEVGGFTVLETPGHSAGHLAFWRDSDRTLIIGDVLFNVHPTTFWPGILGEPKPYYSADPARNRESARRLAQLEPALVCFGHGPPLRDTKKFTDFVAGLPH
jgi:glyoxylase-like metal-dependent hydrolase (beta-lactamase superfamily II)